MRNDSLVRVLRMRRALAGLQTVSLQSLADRFGVSTRTIRRDLESLEAAGEPVPVWRPSEQQASA